MRHLLGIGATTDVQKISRHAARVLNDVHGRHRQAGAVHHAADISVELDVIQAVFRGLDFERVLFRDVAQFFQFGTAEEAVVVEVHLRVEREQASIAARDEWIDLHQRGVGFLERVVQTGHEFHGLIDLLGLEPEFKCQLPRLKRFKAETRSDVLLQDRFWPLGCHLLDIHAACSRGHEHWLSLVAIHQNAEIKFLLDRQRLFHQQPMHDAAFRPCLMSDQFHA